MKKKQNEVKKKIQVPKEGNKGRKQDKRREAHWSLRAAPVSVAGSAVRWAL